MVVGMSTAYMFGQYIISSGGVYAYMCKDYSCMYVQVLPLHVTSNIHFDFEDELMCNFKSTRFEIEIYCNLL